MNTTPAPTKTLVRIDGSYIDPSVIESVQWYTGTETTTDGRKFRSVIVTPSSVIKSHATPHEAVARLFNDKAVDVVLGTFDPSVDDRDREADYDGDN